MVSTVQSTKNPLRRKTRKTRKKEEEERINDAKRRDIIKKLMVAGFSLSTATALAIAYFKHKTRRRRGGRARRINLPLFLSLDGKVQVYSRCRSSSSTLGRKLRELPLPCYIQLVQL